MPKKTLAAGAILATAVAGFASSPAFADTIPVVPAVPGQPVAAVPYPATAVAYQPVVAAPYQPVTPGYLTPGYLVPDYYSGTGNYPGAYAPYAPSGVVPAATPGSWGDSSQHNHVRTRSRQQVLFHKTLIKNMTVKIYARLRRNSCASISVLGASNQICRHRHAEDEGD